MAEEKEKKRKTKAAAASVATAQARPEPQTSGEILRHARTQRGLGLEEVSSAIHIRVVQLRAIEEGNLEGLPGMTYALGFVRSYAQFLKLNPVDIVQKFKAEHGGVGASTRPELHFPEPLPESKMPDPMMIGIAAFFAILLLVAWSVFSGSDDEKVATNEIPPAPVEASAPLLVSPENALSLPAQEPFTPPSEQPLPSTAEAPAAPTEPAAAIPAPEVAAPAPETAPEAAPPTVVVAPPVTVEAPAVTPPVAAAPAPDEPVIAEAPRAPENEIINVTRGKGRIVLKARQSSWVQVNQGQKVLYKKVMKPGEQFVVPDQTGLSLITSNAGGLDVYVDGGKVQPIGKSGEILRGVALDPANLKRKRVRVSNY